MAIVSWNKSLLRGSRIRRTYDSWLIPKEIREAYGISDQDRIQVTVHVPGDPITKVFSVSSGGELKVDKRTSAALNRLARGGSASEVKFSFESLLVSEDVEMPASGELTARATTALAIVAARRGQGLFRRGLESRYGNRCAVTGMQKRELLKASHIKPWSACDDREKLDTDNGLLLVANLDAAFDSRLVSFDDMGVMIGEDDNLRAVLGSIGSKARTVKLRIAPSARQKEYLEHHRQACGLGTA